MVGIIILIILMAIWVSLVAYCWDGIKTASDGIADIRVQGEKLRIYHEYVTIAMYECQIELAKNKHFSMKEALEKLEAIQNIVNIRSDWHERLVVAFRKDFANAVSHWEVVHDADRPNFPSRN